MPPGQVKGALNIQTLLRTGMTVLRSERGLSSPQRVTNLFLHRHERSLIKHHVRAL
jgi:hypothetical protein